MEGLANVLKLSYIADVQGMSLSGLNVAPMNECLKRVKDLENPRDAPPVWELG